MDGITKAKSSTSQSGSVDKMYFVSDAVARVGKSAQTIKRWVRPPKGQKPKIANLGQIKRQRSSGKLVFTEDQMAKIEEYANGLV